MVRMVILVTHATTGSRERMASTLPAAPVTRVAMAQTMSRAVLIRRVSEETAVEAGKAKAAMLETVVTAAIAALRRILGRVALAATPEEVALAPEETEVGVETGGKVSEVLSTEPTAAMAATVGWVQPATAVTPVTVVTELPAVDRAAIDWGQGGNSRAAAVCLGAAARRMERTVYKASQGAYSKVITACSDRMALPVRRLPVD